jgi:short-subunit dehydrogenase
MAGLVDYKNKIAAITGASSGIGAEFARQLARRGARVALVARRQERLDQLSQTIVQAGGEASVHVCDVSDRAAVETTCRDIVGRWGGIDLLINSAGYGRHILFKDHDVEDIERMMQTNYMGAVYWIKSVLPLMRARRAGWIVEISSLAGVTPQPDEAAYSASKYALTGLCEALAYELAPLGIHVLVVHPALVRTEMFTPEVLARLPKSASGSFINPDVFVRSTMQALARGEISVIIPRRFRAVTLLRAISPGLIGRALARIKLAALPDRGR